MKKTNRFYIRWIRFLLRFGGHSWYGRLASRIASIGHPPFHGQVVLANYSKKGFISPQAMLHHSSLELGKHVYIGKGVFIYEDRDGRIVKIKDHVKLIGNTFIQTGFGGLCEIGKGTSIQPQCQFSAYKGPIIIGSNVEIAPFCAFYSYDHGTAPEQPICKQPLHSKGGLTIEDDVWIGVGVMVLDGVRIGKGAVVGAGSVVTKDLPANSISAGVPAHVIRMRDKDFQAESEQ